MPWVSHGENLRSVTDRRYDSRRYPEEIRKKSGGNSAELRRKYRGPDVGIGGGGQSPPGVIGSNLGGRAPSSNAIRRRLVPLEPYGIALSI